MFSSPGRTINLNYCWKNFHLYKNKTTYYIWNKFAVLFAVLHEHRVTASFLHTNVRIKYEHACVTCLSLNVIIQIRSQQYISVLTKILWMLLSRIVAWSYDLLELWVEVRRTHVWISICCTNISSVVNRPRQTVNSEMLTASQIARLPGLTVNPRSGILSLKLRPYTWNHKEKHSDTLT